MTSDAVEYNPATLEVVIETSLVRLALWLLCGVVGIVLVALVKIMSRSSASAASADSNSTIKDPKVSTVATVWRYQTGQWLVNKVDSGTDPC